MVRQGEPTGGKAPDAVGVRIANEDGTPADMARSLVDEFLIKFDALSERGAVVSRDGTRYSPERLQKMRADIEQVRNEILEMSPADAANWRRQLASKEYGSRMVYDAVNCVSATVGRDEWGNILIKMIDILHPGIK